MIKKILLALTIVGLVALVIGIFVFHSKQEPDSTTAKQQPGVVTLEGTITNITNECAMDGICSVTLDGRKTIITGCGLGPNGSCASYDGQSKLRVGHYIEAKVKKVSAYEYNLECPGCTISPR